MNVITLELTDTIASAVSKHQEGIGLSGGINISVAISYANHILSSRASQVPNPPFI